MLSQIQVNKKQSKFHPLDRRILLFYKMEVKKKWKKIEIWSCDPLTSLTDIAAAHNVFQENAGPSQFATGNVVQF